MHSISTSTFLGSVLTATQLRAGLWVNHLEYSSFIDCCWYPKLASPALNMTRELISYRKVGHVGDEDVDLDNLLDAGTSSCENSLQVLDAGGSLLLDGTLNQVALDITRDLARAVDGGRGLDGVGLCIQLCSG